MMINDPKITDDALLKLKRIHIEFQIDDKLQNRIDHHVGLTP